MTARSTAGTSLRPRLGGIHWHRYEGYFFIAPLFFGIFAFILLPILFSFFMSFNVWDMVSPPSFIGLRNYTQLLTRDTLFWTVLQNTFRYALLSIPPSIVFPLLLAVLVNRKVRGVKFYRAAFFMPLVTSVVAVGFLWRWIYDSEFGLINFTLAQIGIQGPKWLTDPFWAMPAIVFTTVWQGLGYNMIIYLSGLQGIPAHLYEAATIDGANALQRFFRITVPLLTPQTFFILVISVIGGFQSFGLIYIMTSGGPMNSTNVYIYYLWQSAIGSAKMGYACAMGWILTLIILTITIIQVRLARYWVNY
jgi:ABC-type sugar transport system permease subunit